MSDIFDSSREKSSEKVQVGGEAYLSPFVQLLPRGSERPRHLLPGQKLFKIDEISRKVSLFTKNPHFYLVTAAGSQKCAPRRFEFQRTRTLTLELNLSFEFKGILDGKEKQFVEALARKEPGTHEEILPPSEVFLRFVNETISRTMQEECDPNSLAIPFKVLDQLARNLNVCAESRFGLDMGAEAFFADADESFKFNTPDFEIHVSNTAALFRYEVGFIPLEKSNQTSELYLPRAAFKNEVEGKVKRWLETTPTLQEVVDKREAVESSLRAHLDDYFVKNYGLQVQHFVLMPGKVAEPPPSEVEFKVECKVNPNETEVTIRHQLDIEVTDIARYKQSSVSNFEQWIRDVLRSSTTRALREKTYTDLLLAFEPIKGEIESAVEKKADEVGLHVRQLIAVPELPLRKLMDEGFRVRVVCGLENQALPPSQNPADNDPDEQQPADQSTAGPGEIGGGLITKDDRVQFPCRIDVKGRIRDLNSLKDLISPSWDWEADMKQAISQSAEDVTRKLSPEELFLAFDVEGQVEYDLDLMSVKTVDELKNIGSSLVVIALVGETLHIRIFDADGTIALDNPRSALIQGAELDALENQVRSIISKYPSAESSDEKRILIRNATLVSGYTTPAPAQQIKGAIIESLKSSFDADRNTLRIDIADRQTHFSRVYDTLTSQPWPLEVSISPVNSADEKIKFNFAYRYLRALSSWGQFQNAANHRTADKLRENVEFLITSICKQNLQSLTAEDLKCSDFQKKERIRDRAVQSEVTEEVSEQFGLMVSFVTIDRPPTKAEIGRGTKTREVIEEEIQDTLKDLVDERKGLRAQIKRIRAAPKNEHTQKRIGDLEAELSAVTIRIAQFSAGAGVSIPEGMQLPNSSASDRFLGTSDPDSEEKEETS